MQTTWFLPLSTTKWRRPRSRPARPVLRIRRIMLDRLRGFRPPHYAWGMISGQPGGPVPVWARKPRPKRR